MSDGRGSGRLGNILFASVLLIIGGGCVFSQIVGKANQNDKVFWFGCVAVVVAVVLGPEGGFSALERVKSIAPGLFNRLLGHPAPQTTATSSDSDDSAEMFEGSGSVQPEDVAGAEQLSNDEKEVLGFRKAPPALAKADTELIRDLLFEVTVPTYILNQDFHILDWNPAFEVAFGVHCRKLRRLLHVSQLIHYLDDSAEIIRHGAEVFGGPVEPLVDFEVLGYQSPTYGQMEFGKITSRATHPESGETIGWNVVLNVQHVEKRKEYEEALRNELAEQVNWRVYSTSYDHVLLRFSEYRNLIKRHVDAVSARKKILDLGAGTGNVTLELLKAGKEVTAVDYNEAMLTRLREKCGEFRAADQLKIVKQNLDSMRIARVDRETFDGVIMQNVLYALKDPERVLKLVYDALAPNGILVVSGPKEGTSLDALFTAIRNELKDEHDWEESLAEDFENVLDRNKVLEGQGVIHQWTIAEVRELLEKSGFKITDQENDAYAGQAMILIAQRV